MEWVLALIASWAVLAVLHKADSSKLTYVGGLLAVIMQMIIDVNARILDLYHIKGGFISIFGSPLFFTIGPVFTMAILFLQYFPRGKWWQAAHIVVFFILFFTFELGVISTGNLVYINWNYMGSIFIDVTVLMALSWYGAVFVMDTIQNR